MRDTPLDPLVGSESVVRPEFVEELADRLRSELRGVTSIEVRASTAARSRPRRMWIVGAAAAAVALVGTATWATRSDHRVPAPSATEPAQPPVATVSTVPAATVPAASVSPSTPTSTASPLTSTTIPVDQLQPVAIGDSVMLGAAEQLAAGGFVVDARESRQGADTAELVEDLAAAGELGRAVVVQVGLNGPVTDDVYRRIAQALIGSGQVVFLTVHADRSWIPGNNEIIRSLPAQYPNISVLDWDELVASGAIAGFAADGIHLATSEARQSYANAVFTALGLDDLVRTTRVSGLFVTVSDDRPAVIDLHDAAGLVRSFDLGCPAERTCTVESTRIIGDSIWVAVNDTGTDGSTVDVGARVVSVSVTNGEIVEHLGRRGTTTVRSAGLGTNGVLYAYLHDETDGRQLVAIDGDTVTVLATGVSGFLLSDDGRFLAVSFSNPPAGEQPRIQVTDLADGTTNSFTTDGINAGPGAWSPDGRHLIVNEQWEDGTAWVVDPWSASSRPSAEAGQFLDGACFVDAGTIAHRTWNVGYGQGDAQTGTVRLIALDDGSTRAELGTDLFGDALRCHPDGSITYLRRPVVVVDHGGGFSQPEPDPDAPVELVHIAPDGTSTSITSGLLRMV